MRNIVPTCNPQENLFWHSAITAAQTLEDPALLKSQCTSPCVVALPVVRLSQVDHQNSIIAGMQLLAEDRVSMPLLRFVRCLGLLKEPSRTSFMPGLSARKSYKFGFFMALLLP